MMVKNAVPLRRNNRGGRLASRIFLAIGLAIGANVILTALAGIFIGRFQELPGNASLDAQRPHREKITLPPRDSAVDTAGFIHIGKTGGSTITTLLRNGCNSFVDGPCRNITNESAISKLVVRVRSKFHLFLFGSSLVSCCFCRQTASNSASSSSSTASSRNITTMCRISGGFLRQTTKYLSFR